MIKRTNAVFIVIVTLLLSLPIVEAQPYRAPMAENAPIIDGKPNDEAWAAAKWHAIDQFIMGDKTDPTDFSGRFKIVWTPERLFVLAEMSDDVLLDRTANPRVRYWEDDIFEVLIDENSSGGLHHKSYNAFAYHISLDNQAVDIGDSGEVVSLNNHIKSKWQREQGSSGLIVWEVSLKIYDETYTDSMPAPDPIILSNGKKMGFMIAYCDADDPAKGRENFITSHDIKPVNGDKNRAYIDASVFGKMELVMK